MHISVVNPIVIPKLGMAKKPPISGQIGDGLFFCLPQAEKCLHTGRCCELLFCDPRLELRKYLPKGCLMGWLMALGYDKKPSLALWCPIRHVPKPAIWHVQKWPSCKGTDEVASRPYGNTCLLFLVMVSSVLQHNRAIAVLGLDWADGVGWRSILRELDTI